MKVNVISTKLIKPCTPTPQNLNKYQISLTDELAAPLNINVILFYPSSNHAPKPISAHLQESLAKILPQYYPLAGRYIKKDRLVDCNDEGAEFVEAEATDIELMIDLKTKNVPLDDLLSRQFYEIDQATDPLLSIQITTFKCGGLTIGISVSHRILDGSSFGTFVAAWSNSARGITIISPTFDSLTLFPRQNIAIDFEPPRTRDTTIVAKRLLFNKEDITNLRSKIRPKKSCEKVIVSRVRLAKNGKSRECFIYQLIDMRGRTIPPLPKHSCGNLAIPTVTQCMAADETSMEMGFEELVYQHGDDINKTISGVAQMFSSGEDGNSVILGSIDKIKEIFMTANILMFSDFSKFGFYEADFGWGKPVWAGIGTLPREQSTTLMANKEGDGIEAWVHLNQNDVPDFERYLQSSKMELEDL
ncbi:pelargonidin 3-o-(6-caffeoylglucoside) 5-o-(6-o-malonylglucoside) 4'''-malonyltransferase [Phtheirospermum japonicum]|uniref:Pelargonidin 3-o-(6-caffeoylglucoside) 5-o-(6-o-malonylglucoside) 4'''-malonyltransferase n=1 Tax=Phtheirospermum japonicum TaxID=374723 RepID=A0A830BPT0_9LAMI|nr:pelargonidin 3-o-(6-caffeoylglucoside) 5-o-(6-o-malonylglucoside) 4'''-malonyltransferase [Phtheirospermum japonicum]